MAVDWKTRLKSNLERVHERIAAAEARAGRPECNVRVVAVTKYVSETVIRALVELGCTTLGENRVQQIVERAGGFAETIGGDWIDAQDAGGGQTGARRANWHMIGHLQRNKVRLLLPLVRVIHSLDSLRLAEEIQQQSVRLNLVCDAFVEVNVSGEQSKDGTSPETVEAIFDGLRPCDRIRVRGLMTMAPISEDAEASRPCFARLRELLAGLRSRGIVPASCIHLSMGMSGDFEAAIAEGATFVRIGSALFEGIESRAG